MDRWVEFALRTWPREERERVWHETVEAARKGYEKRTRRSSAEARRFARRVVWDLVRTGLKQRRAALVHAARQRGAELGTDVRLSLRRLWKSPGYSGATIGIVALGIGCNAAVFSALRTITLVGPPLPESEELGLVRVAQITEGDTTWGGWSRPEFEDLSQGSARIFSHVATYALRRGALSEPGAPEYLGYELVSDEYFDVVGLPLTLGVGFEAAAGNLGAADDLVILSHRVWSGRFGSDRGVVGSTVTFEGERLRVVGVGPAGFGGVTGDADLWVPIASGMTLLGPWTERRDITWLQVIGRTRTEISESALVDPLRVLGRAVTEASPRSGEEVDVRFTALSELWIPDTLRSSLFVATGASATILAMALLNLIALTLVRERRRAAVTRLQLALGGSRSRIVRERIVEAQLLALLGGALGIGIAMIGAEALGSLWPAHLFRGSGFLRLLDGASFRLDWVLMGLAIGAALICGLVAGGTSSWFHLRGASLVRRSKDPKRSWGGRALRDGVWIAQVAFAAALLIVSGLLLTTVQNLKDRQMGYESGRYLVLHYSLFGQPSGGTAELAAEFHREFRRRLRGISEVSEVSVSSSPPLGGGFIASRLEEVEGSPPSAESEQPEIGVHFVDETYFRTLGVEFLEGRGFDSAEIVEGFPGVVITRTAAERLFGDRSALGRRISFRANTRSGQNRWTVVGVTEDILFRESVRGLQPEMFLPLGTFDAYALAAIVRTDSSPSAIIPAARSIFSEMAPGVAFTSIRTSDEIRASDLAGGRAVSTVVGVFTVLAGVLATLGLGATAAQMISERRSEIGVRMALGARASGVRLHVLRKRIPPVLLGTMAGLSLAYMASTRLENLLVDVDPTDPRIFIASAGLLIAASAIAIWIPTQIVTRTDPSAVLRSGAGTEG